MWADRSRTFTYFAAVSVLIRKTCSPATRTSHDEPRRSLLACVATSLGTARNGSAERELTAHGTGTVTNGALEQSFGRIGRATAEVWPLIRLFKQSVFGGYGSSLPCVEPPRVVPRVRYGRLRYTCPRRATCQLREGSTPLL